MSSATSSLGYEVSPEKKVPCPGLLIAVYEKKGADCVVIRTNW